MNNATISADIISYTSLAEVDKRNIEQKIKSLIHLLTKQYGQENFIGRNIQGDYIEFALKKPARALRIALLLKTYLKSQELKEENLTNIRTKYFKEHAVRLAVAVAPLSTLNISKGIIDGEAIYMSGRAIKNLSTSNKKKIIIKNTMFFCSREEKTQEKFELIFSLLDTLISKSSGKQCEVIYYKLLGNSEKSISALLNKSQSTISQHSIAGGWHAIEKSVTYFEKNII